MPHAQIPGAESCSPCVQAVGTILAEQPWIPAVTLLVFGLLCGLGLFGVIKAADRCAVQ